MQSATRPWLLVCSVAMLILGNPCRSCAQPNLAVSESPSSLSFGAVSINALSAPQGFTVMNTGSQGITIANVASSSSQFTVTGPSLPLTVNPGQGASFQVEFEPTTAGTFSGSINVTLNRYAGGVQSIAVSGSGLSSTTPNITSVSPSSGPVGTSVTITGTNFGATQGTISFNGTPATPTSWSATSIVAPVPAGATTGNVVVAVGGVASAGVAFSVGSIAPLAFVQVNFATPQAAQTPVTVTYTRSQTAGNLNVVVVGWNDAVAQVNSVVDSKGNAYFLAVGPTVQSGTQTQAIYYAKNIAAAAANSNTVTVSFSQAAASPDVRIAEYSGIDPTTPVDVVATAQGSGTSSSSGSVTTGNASDLLVGANQVQTLTTGSGSGYTSRVITTPDGNILEDCMVATAGSYSATAAVSPSGKWIMQMVAFRAAGSGMGTSLSITSVSPSSGPVGTSVTITGTNFGATQGTITFNGTPATPTSWSATSIVAPVPAGATTGNVVVTVGAQASNGFNFTVSPTTPNITSVSPSSGPVGTSVTITGTNFGATQGTITFNGTPATPTSWSATSIVAPVPAGATTGNVVVTVGAQASNGFNFTVSPTTPNITSVSPSSGPVGTSVTITGTNFGATQGTITFNGTPATPTSWSATSIVAPVPAGATTGNVVVTVGAQASNGFNFTVSPTTPNITSVSPSSGPVGTSVTITGTNFGATQGTISFNGTPATPTSWSATSIVAPVPAGATTGNVVVAVGGVASAGVAFSVGSIAPLAFVQVNFATPQAAQTPVTVTYTRSQTAGNLNVVVVGWNDAVAQVNSVVDSKGNAYFLAVGPTVQSGTQTQAIYYAKNIAAAAANSNTVTVSFSQAAASPDVRIAEYSGIDPTTPVDVVATAQGSGTSSSSGSVTTGNASDLLVGANQVQTLTTGSGSGYTSRVITTPDGNILEDCMVATAGSYSATAAVSPSGKWIMQMVAFRAAGSGMGTSLSITSVSPSSGPVGTSVTITGTNFGATQGTITFNGTPATPTSWSATSIVAPVPAGATTGNVVVTVGAQASNGFNFTVSPTTPNITSVSPSSGPVGTSVTITGTNFGATQGTITFNGTPAAPTSWSATSIVAPVPTGATTGNVVVTVGAQASNGLGFSVTMALPGVPKLVQHVSCPNSGATGSGVGGARSGTPIYLCPLPELTQAGNALVLGFFSDNTGNPTWTVSDDKSNTWTLASSTSDSSGNIIAVYYALNVAAGTHMLSVRSSAQTAGYLTVSASEYYNVATSSALDTSHCNAGSSSTSITAGSITPGTSGDLLWQWAADANVASVNSFTAGSQSAIGWQLNGTDIYFGDAVQAGVYVGTAALNPTFTSATAKPFDSCVMALKAASAGNPPTNAFRIVHMLHAQMSSSGSSPYAMQFPTSGNLLVLSFISGSTTITGITSSPSNTWSSTGAAASYGSQVVSQMYYAANASTSNSMTLSVSWNGGATGLTYMMYDITGAAASPFDKDSGGQTGNQASIVTSLTSCSSCLSPTGVPGGDELIIGNVGNAWDTATAITSPSGALFDTATYTGNSVNGPESVDQNNGWFHYYDSGTSALTATWTYATGSTQEGSWAGRVAAFKPASVTTGNVVETAGDQASNGSSFEQTTASPSISSLSPDSGSVGTSLTITGMNFGTRQGSSTISFNGTVATPTKWSATSLIASVPDGATTGNVVVTVGGRASNGFGFTLNPALPGVPTLVQHVSSSNTRNNAFASPFCYYFQLANPTTSGNAVIVGFTFSNNPTPTVTDDKGDRYAMMENYYDYADRQSVAIAAAFNVSFGARNISVCFSSDPGKYVQPMATEFNNVIATDGSGAGSHGTGTSATAGSLTPTVSGDLAYQVVFSLSVSQSSFAAGTEGNITWDLLSADLMDGWAGQYAVDDSTSAIHPTMKLGTSQKWVSAAILLEAGPSGSVPSGMRIVHLVSENIPHHASAGGTGSPFPNPLLLQLPSSGNLLVAMIGERGGNADTITSVTDSNNNGWRQAGSTLATANGETVQAYYAADATPSSKLGLTVYWTGASGDDTIFFYDVTGAATSPLDTTSGTTGDQSSTDAPFAVAYTLLPSQSGELIFTDAFWDHNPGTGLSSNVGTSYFDMYISSGDALSVSDPYHESEGWGHAISTSASAITFTWSQSSLLLAAGNYASLAVAFKAADPPGN